MSKARIRAAFSQAATTYDQAATVQKRVVESLAGFLDQYLDASSRRLPAVERILDVGSGTGFARPLLASRFPQADQLALDFSETMLRQASGRRICGDAEALPVRDASIDLVWSNLTWQWCDLPTALAEARRVLRRDGKLAFATLTEGTFEELRSAFADLDGHAHTQAMLEAEAVMDAVAAAGFTELETRRERIVAHYPTLKALLTAVRQTGASEVSGPRRRGMLGRQGWARIEAAYAKHVTPGGLPLSYDVLYVVAKKSC